MHVMQPDLLCHIYENSKVTFGLLGDSSLLHLFLLQCIDESDK